VVLVDSDLRRPMLHRLFQLRNREGLTDVLLDGEPMLNGRLQETGIENLRVMTSGPLPPNPSELLGSQKMKRVLERIEGEADVVLLDAPPLLPVTDAAVLASQADGVLVVSEAGRTRQGPLKRALLILEQAGANVLGAVLNRAPKRSWRGQYYYYQYYTTDQTERQRRKRRRRVRIPVPEDQPSPALWD
jgi:capsular exopolysaccharide synthesis family protein